MFLYSWKGGPHRWPSSPCHTYHAISFHIGSISWHSNGMASRGVPGLERSRQKRREKKRSLFCFLPQGGMSRPRPAVLISQSGHVLISRPRRRPRLLFLSPPRFFPHNFFFLSPTSSHNVFSTSSSSSTTLPKPFHYSFNSFNSSTLLELHRCIIATLLTRLLRLLSSRYRVAPCSSSLLFPISNAFNSPLFTFFTSRHPLSYTLCPFTSTYSSCISVF